MAMQYLFDPNKQFQSIGGVNEVGGFLRVFLNGTDDRATTYKNFDETLNEADIVLDSYGRAVVIVDDTKTYRIEVYNRLGGLMWTVSNYKARGGSGVGTGTPVSVEGTVGEIDVYENTEGGVKHFVVGLAATIKNAITTLTMAVNGVANALNGKKDKQTPVNESGSTTKTIVGISQDSDGVMTAEFDDIAFPDWTSAINAAVATCENLENKKTTVTGFESSNTYYPTIKAVVDFVNGMLQNLGGKLITDNGDPFTSSASLPSSTPYGGVDIADKDYAYVQGVGTAERWSATVSGSDVTWVQEYSINIPVFTPAQQAAIDSGATSTKINNYELHINNTAIHVTSSEKNDWNAKQNAIGDLAGIRRGAAAGATALQPSGNGSNVTSTFTAASSRTNISSGEKLSTIFGKIAKWFSDLKAVAFSGSYNDLTNTPTIPTELPVKIEEIGGSAVDLDSLTASDMKVHYYTWSNGNRGNVSHKPTDAVYTVKVFPCGAGSAGTYVMQEAYKRGTTERYVRRRSDGGTAWSAWSSICLVQSQVGNYETPVYVDVSGELKVCDTSKYYMRWNDTTPQWTTYGVMADAAVRIWYAKNYCVNYANFSLNNSHPALCYIVCTLPSLTSNEIYDLSIEITIRGNGSSIQGGTAILLIDSEDSDFTILSEYAPNGVGGFLNIPQNRIDLPSNGFSVKYKVYVSGHAYRVARIA